MKNILLVIATLVSTQAFAELPDEWCTKVDSLEYKSDSIQINEKNNINSKFFLDNYSVDAASAVRLEKQATKAIEIAVSTGKTFCISKSTRGSVYSVGVKP